MIPAYNEDKTIGSVIEEIPRKIDGLDSVEVLVISDDSTNFFFPAIPRAYFL